MTRWGQVRVRVLALVTSTVLSASALGAGGSASAAGPDLPGQGPRTVATEPPPVYASGVIVRTVDGTVSSSLRADAERLTAGAVTRTRPVINRFRALDFESPVAIAQAKEVADRLAKRGDVLSAEPDVIVNTATNSPVPRNDPLFSRQYGVWDRRSSFQGLTLPVGGYSVRAPYLWRATSGKSNVRVAVIDTGVTDHPDLAGSTVAGYDFFSDLSTDRDSTPGPDADPSDPGDWTAAGDCAGSGLQNSSWHGTHVAGIIAAVANNGEGIAGIASSARVEPIRVLGPCGGSSSDVAKAIVWAAGGSVPGVPGNLLPAKVINLSLGAAGACLPDSLYQTAVTTARGLGSVVVAAAGNGSDAQTVAPISSPANCAGVIAVVATDEIGRVALYSSIGDGTRRADVSAPGGNQAFSGFSGIFSTLNAGTTSPVESSIYVQYQGTSMATPAVAAGAALLRSLGYSGSEIETALTFAVRGFPQYDGDDAVFNCDTTACGAGILDLAKVPAPYGTTKIVGTMKTGNTVRVSTYWTGSPKRSYRWYRNGTAIRGAINSYYRLTTADRYRSITVKVTGTKQGFKTLSRTSAARKAY